MTDEATYCAEVNRAAHRLLDRGFAVVDAPPGSKNPGRKGWTAERLTAEDVDRRFNGSARNLFVLLGEPSGGLIDADFDQPEAARAAQYLMPATGSKHGRLSSRMSHNHYICTPPPRTTKYADPDLDASGKPVMLLEIRSTGCGTVWPPSIHPSGDRYVIEMDDDPATVDGGELLRCAARTAAAAMTARRWREGIRHEAAQALSGALLRGGVSTDDTRRFVEVVARVAADSEVEDRVRCVTDTEAALHAGNAATGVPTLIKLFGERYVTKLREWMGLVAAAEERVDQEREERRPRFRLLTDAEIESRTPPDMLVAGVVPAGGLGIMWGAPGSLKTFAMLDIAMHVQTGREWHGRAVRQGRILYVVAEGSAQFGRRVAAWKAWRRVEGDTGALWLADAVQLREHSDIAALVDAIEGATSEPIAMIVLDTLSRCAVGAEENSATDTGLLIAGCDMIRRRTGASTWLIHHSAKNGLHERGSSALRGAADVMISANVDGDVLSLRCDKAKDVEPFADLYMRRRVIEFPTGATSLVLDPVDRDEATVRPASVGLLTGAARDAHEVLTSHFGQTGATATEWRLAAGMSESSFYRARSLLLKWEYVRQSDKRYWAVT